VWTFLKQVCPLPVVLGVSASLRNARYGRGNEALVRDLADLSDQSALTEWLCTQTQIRFQDFVDAGRGEKLPFDAIYDRLRRLRGERGLSNSEAAVAAALWGALQEGAEIRHLSLAHHFPMTGKARDLAKLRQSLIEADAIVISGPVYFGDRGSLTQSLIDFIAADPALRDACAGKVYAGLAVGAKRNGGQETTLIYQLLDMVNLDFLAVGNSSETTSQYGGTAVAGDVGALHKDAEGIETCVGTGQRAARTAALLTRGRAEGGRLEDRLKLQLWLLQDAADGTGRRYFDAWAAEAMAADPNLDVQVLGVTDVQVLRCIACDVCPVDVGPKEDYRCIIKAPGDFFVQHHKTLTEADAVLLCAYSPQDRSQVISVYQQFIERTRYLRRDNYVFSDLLMAPFVISELSARQNLHLRMLTSAVRHHTVLHHPLIGLIHEGRILGEADLRQRAADFITRARELTVGRYLSGLREDVIYQPKGYDISAQKAVEDQATGRTRDSIQANARAHVTNARRRMAS
jgi:multimeric flavodoxin WrbA